MNFLQKYVSRILAIGKSPVCAEGPMCSCLKPCILLDTAITCMHMQGLRIVTNVLESRKEELRLEEKARCIKLEWAR